MAMEIKPNNMTCLVTTTYTIPFTTIRLFANHSQKWIEQVSKAFRILILFQTLIIQQIQTTKTNLQCSRSKLLAFRSTNESSANNHHRNANFA